MKRDFDGKTRAGENPRMDANPKDETGESNNQGSPEATVETPQSKVRDLPPEKDPMGAGRKRRPETDAAKH